MDNKLYLAVIALSLIAAVVNIAGGNMAALWPNLNVAFLSFIIARYGLKNPIK